MAERLQGRRYQAADLPDDIDPEVQLQILYGSNMTIAAKRRLLYHAVRRRDRSRCWLSYEKPPWWPEDVEYMSPQNTRSFDSCHIDQLFPVCQAFLFERLPKLQVNEAEGHQGEQLVDVKAQLSDVRAQLSDLRAKHEGTTVFPRKSAPPRMSAPLE